MPSLFKIIRVTLLVALVLGLNSVTTFGGTYQWHPSSGLTLGVSFDPLDLEIGVHDCINMKGEVKNIDVGTEGSVETQVSVDQIKSARELYERLKIDVRMNARYLFFSGANSLSYENENSFSEDSLTLMVRFYSDYGRFKMVDPALKDYASKLLADGKNSEFARRCGTEFISIQRKAALVAIIFSVKNISSQSMNNINTSMQAAASFMIGSGVGSGSLDADQQKQLKETLQHTRISVQFFARGGKGMKSTSRFITSIDDLSNIRGEVADYVKEVNAENAVPVEYISQSMTEFGHNPGNIGFSNDDIVTEAYFQYRYSEAVIKRIDQILDNQPTLYSYLTKADIEKYTGLKQQHFIYLGTLQKAIKLCRDPKQTCALPADSPPKVTFPSVGIVITERVKVHDLMVRVRGYITGGVFDQVYYVDWANSLVTLKAGSADPRFLTLGSNKYYLKLDTAAGGKQTFEVHVTLTPIASGNTPRAQLALKDFLGNELRTQELLQ